MQWSLLIKFRIKFHYHHQGWSPNHCGRYLISLESALLITNAELCKQHFVTKAHPKIEFYSKMPAPSSDCKLRGILPGGKLLFADQILRIRVYHLKRSRFNYFTHQKKKKEIIQLHLKCLNVKQFLHSFMNIYVILHAKMCSLPVWKSCSFLISNGLIFLCAEKRYISLAITFSQSW